MKEKFKVNNLLNYFTQEQIEKIIKIDNIYFKAQIIVTILFKDKVDKAGAPYIEHLYRVSSKLKEPIEKVAALLHDTVEDTEVTFEDLFEMGFPVEVLEIVKLVTKPNIDTSNLTNEEKLKIYSDEIDKIINSGNIHAIRLKESDMSDNYNLDRLKELPEDRQEWFHQKYGKQLVKLRNVKGEKNI